MNVTSSFTLNGSPPTSLDQCAALDRADPLGPLRHHFALPDDVIYLDGNSLGALPRSTGPRVARAVTQEWGAGLIQSWNDAGWFSLPQSVGDRIARLIGAQAGEVLAVDGTSINLFKVLSAALHIAQNRSPHPLRVLSEVGNFPTDLYIAEGACRTYGASLECVSTEQLDAALSTRPNVLMLTHVNYRTGAMHDMHALTARAHEAGATVIWDLAHSAGAVPVDLRAANADFAIGCGYKYLNGGPGAPGFVWVHPRHVDRALQPLSGWWGHAQPFAFTPAYEPATGIGRYQCGSQPILSLIALDEGVGSVLRAEAAGGMQAIRAKSLALTDLFIAELKRRLPEAGFGLETPLAHAMRGSQVSLTRAEGAYAIVQALIARGVIGDFRAGDGKDAPDILRFGFAPLYTRFVDVWRAVDTLEEIMRSENWRQPRFAKRREVT